MIDSLMKEIGIEGGSLGRMTEVLRDAKDIEALTSKRAKARSRQARPVTRDDATTNVRTWKMAKVYVSDVIPAPASAVWAVVRDFNGLPKWTASSRRAGSSRTRRPTRSAASAISG